MFDVGRDTERLKWGKLINFSVWAVILAHFNIRTAEKKGLFSLWENDNRWKMIISTQIQFNIKNMLFSVHCGTSE